MYDRDRFWRRVKKTSDCWIWQGKPNSFGYGVIYSNKSGHEKAHRFAYRDLKGPIPSGFQLDHLCRNRLCVNPKHLEPVSNRVNVLRGVGVCAMNARKKKCGKGHVFNFENTILRKDGTRKCRECGRASTRKYSARQRIERSVRK